MWYVNQRKMTSKAPPTRLFEEQVRDEVRDLRSTYIFTGILVICLAAMIVASSENVIALQIPPTELALVAMAALLVTMVGFWGLQQGWSANRLAWISLVVL